MSNVTVSKESVSDFFVGHGSADSVRRPIVDPSLATPVYKGVRVRAVKSNTDALYVGPASVTASPAGGYPLAAGDELSLPIEDPSKVWVVGAPTNNTVQTVTLANTVVGDKFHLSFGGVDTAELALTAVADDVEDELEVFFGVGNVQVTGTPGTALVVSFIGALAKQDVAALTGAGGTNEQQTVTLDPGVSAGTFTLALGSTVSAPISFDSPHAAMQTILEAAFGVGNVAVTGGPGSPWTIEFKGALANQPVALLVGDGTLLTTADATVTIEESVAGLVGTNEQQTVALDASASAGTFTLALGTDVSAPIDFDSTHAAMQTKLEALLGAGNVAVTGGPASPWTIEFKGALANQPVALLVGDGTLLTAADITVTIGESVAGNTETISVVAVQSSATCGYSWIAI